MTAFKPADILLPKNTDMTKWAVVACDQYTSEPQYWADVEKITQGSKTTLDLILPEVYLEGDDVDTRIARIHEKMNEYTAQDSFTEYKDSLIYIERTQADGKVRAGIVGAIDLEEYDYNKGSKSKVRATEATVVERIPPRIKVRRGAPVELPHIMILIDDVKKQVVEPLAAKKDSFEKVYDFDMMKNGGHITGWLIDKQTQSELLAAFDKLDSQAEFNERYGYENEAPLTFAMGDGNHSLATAKAFYEEQKAQNPGKDMTNARCRYALVEIVDLHSPALEFEAIHRICTGIDRAKLMAEMTEALGLSKEPSEQKITVVTDAKHEDLYIHKPSSKLTVGSLQNFLDAYMKENGGKIDYIHGTEVIDSLSNSGDALGVLLPDMAKSELFPTVICDGALPRKTFSMGHAWDKRYYVEARRIAD
ncbi:DUF1015 domain-containing protein [Ruminococcus sp. FC2018]|uniref:DUF1015 domain-containing protein n=1 Tax=Ruminococcus sp. FC2018 TaxID=1410617 RepID=UPI00056CA6BC|nr:DUF1015 domain-containing protein [Ruminococcus sp. FC2018]